MDSNDDASIDHIHVTYADDEHDDNHDYDDNIDDDHHHGNTNDIYGRNTGNSQELIKSGQARSSGVDEVSP